MVHLQDDMFDDDLEMNENIGVTSKHMKSLENLFRKFEDYCKELAVSGFNSAGYDIKSIKKYLFKELCKPGQQPNFTIRRLESIHASRNFTVFSPRIQLEKFFQSLWCYRARRIFPYDYFTHTDQLDESTLPPHETFYSTVKNCNVLEEEYASFQKLLDQGKSEQEALQSLRLPTKPKTGPESYQWLQQL